MRPLTSQIPREFAQRLGRETLSIGEKGIYKTPSGHTIDLREEIARSVRGTRSYSPDLLLKDALNGEHTTIIEITNETTLSAATRLLQRRLNTVVLNFASATSPGGGFLVGARAQEEYLARSSCPYQCICDNPMYAFHRSHYDPFYSDTILYSPEVPVIRDDDGALLEEPYTVSIITSPAVNASKVPPERRKDISPVMWRRILKVLGVGAAHDHDGIVLGAWGCGAFGNDGSVISGLFCKALKSNFRGVFRHVVFAIVDWSPERKFIQPFEDAFG